MTFKSNAQLVQEKYLKILYSEKEWAKCKEDKTEQMLVLKSSIDIERLIVERKARVRNLRTHLHQSLLLLPKFLTRKEFLPLVTNFCNSDLFWEYKGRTLEENFCFYLIKQNELNGPLQDLAKIDGILIGLGSNSKAPSPWGNSNYPSSSIENDKDDSSVIFEEFETLYGFDIERILEGSFTNIDEIKEEPGIIQVSIEEDGETFITYAPYVTEGDHE